MPDDKINEEEAPPIVKYKLETREDFDKFLAEADKLIDTGAYQKPDYDPDAPDPMSFRFTF